MVPSSLARKNAVVVGGLVVVTSCVVVVVVGRTDVVNLGLGGDFTIGSLGLDSRGGFFLGNFWVFFK